MNAIINFWWNDLNFGLMGTITMRWMNWYKLKLPEVTNGPPNDQCWWATTCWVRDWVCSHHHGSRLTMATVACLAWCCMNCRRCYRCYRHRHQRKKRRRRHPCCCCLLTPNLHCSLIYPPWLTPVLTLSSENSEIVSSMNIFSQINSFGRVQIIGLMRIAGQVVAFFKFWRFHH